MNYAGKHALVVGLGESGLAMSVWLARCGARVRVADTRDAPERLDRLRAAIPQAQFHGGPLTPALLDGIDFIAVSPGLAPARELSPLIAAAATHEMPIWSEIELFAQALAEMRERTHYAPKVIAITGTNGKTTVTSMTGLLCQRAGLKVRVAGNISPAALDVLGEAIDNEALPEVWVLELSSFQLHFTCSLEADAATVLNLSQDHLDWHGSMDAYMADKARIFGRRTVQVLNRDDAAVMQLALPLVPVITFGAEPPEQPACFGLVTENDMQWLAVAVAGEQTDSRRGRKAPGAVAAGSISRLMPADALKIRGQHNAVNALAALALCRAIGLALAPLLHGLRDYQGEPHRVELVATVDGVAYYDDSKGTNVGATVAALIGLGRQQPPASRLILIAGGDGKGQDFTPLQQPIAAHTRAVVLIGQDAPALRTMLQSSGVALHDCATMEEAVAVAATLAHSGDAVLLSPACASFDMFNNYVHRAEVFVAAVREQALTRGEVMP